MNNKTKLDKNLLFRLLINTINFKSKISKRFKRLIDKKKIGSFEFRLKLNALERMHYAYILLNAANLAKKLDYKKISAVEFGVANGRGLLILEEYAQEIKKLTGVEIDIYGFDLGTGLPAPLDYRDLPYHWDKGSFKMQHDLKARLKHAKLILGNIEETSKEFFSKYNPAPIGAVIHDFDFYSSTKTAFQMFKENNNYFLPRVYNYFDDTIGSETELFNDFTGERLAINEFNLENNNIKIAKSYHFKMKQNEIWHHQIWITHFFKHEKYNSFIDIPDRHV